MPLTLQLVNEKTLPDGGPVSIHVSGKRGIDIGRAAHLDWTLPDPTRYISSKHCEIRYRDGGYWLHDVSTNGTFLNGASHRMSEPHRLRTGDRFLVGQYIVAAAVEGDEEEAPPQAAAFSGNPAAVGDQDWWSTGGQAPPPIDPKDLRPARNNAPVNPDFLDWAADVPDTFERGSTLPLSRPQPVAAAPSMDWDAGPPSRVPAPPPPSAPVPAPRRPDWEPRGDDQGVGRDTFAGAGAGPDWAQSDSEVLATPMRAGSMGGSREALVEGSPSTRSIGRARPSSPPSFAVPGADGALNSFICQLAEAAGLSPELLAQKDSAQLAQQFGGLVRLAVDNLMQLLRARQQAKRLAHTADHTMVQATGNNPLKFCPSVEDALRVMFGPANPGYLDADRAITQGFEDLKSHQIKTYSAMQHALTMIMADLDPKAIGRDTEGTNAVGRLLQSRKAQLWDAYEARWEAKVENKGGEPIEAFLRYFAEFYDGEPASR